jgi:hypothetical protein
MKIKIITLKYYIWIGIIFFLIFSFPIQVILSSPLPSLFPYLGILLLFFITKFFNHIPSKIIYKNKNIEHFIKVYIFLVIFHSSWQCLFKFISIGNGITAIVIYILPVIFYWYGIKYTTEKEFKIILFSIVIFGLCSGLYFVYDSYSMLVNAQVSEFSHKIMEYTKSRAPDRTEFNVSRISEGIRSHGMLEKHSISAAWTALSCFAILAIIPLKHLKTRLLIVSIYFFMLLISLNFTSIVAFIFVIAFIELKVFYIFKGLISKNSFKFFGYSLLILFSALIYISIYSKDLYELLIFRIPDQLSLALGLRSLNDDSTFIGTFLSGYFKYPLNMLSFPPGILIGDGFSNWGVTNKGGDFGHIDLVHRLGFPLYFAIIYGLFRLTKQSLNKIRLANWELDKGARYLQFSVSAILYILVTTIHYNTWDTKSTLPLFFICIVFISRYLYSLHEQLD